MINDKNLKQESGNDATNFQANAIVVNQGISYQDAKSIALDVFDNNYIRLSEIASQRAKLRAEELIEEFLETAKSKVDIELDNIQNPSFQISLFNAQKEYANRGNEELKKYLTQLLIKLLQFEEDTYEGIIYQESIVSISKLTTSQINILALIYLIRDLDYFAKINSYSDLDKVIDCFVTHFSSAILKDRYQYFHLTYIGVANIITKSDTIESLLLKKVPGAFQKGYTKKQIEFELSSFLDKEKFYRPQKRQKGLFEFNVFNFENIRNDNIEVGRLIALLSRSLMEESEVNKIICKNEKFAAIVKEWKDIISTIRLTNVGKLIAEERLQLIQNFL